MSDALPFPPLEERKRGGGKGTLIGESKERKTGMSCEGPWRFVTVQDTETPLDFALDDAKSCVPRP